MTLQVDVRAVIGTPVPALSVQMVNDLAARAADQLGRLTGPPIPVDFTYDRNGLRLGIAALEDELRELYDEWAEAKRNLADPDVAARIRHEVLDIAAVAMLIYRNCPQPDLDGVAMADEPCSRRCGYYDSGQSLIDHERHEHRQ